MEPLRNYFQYKVKIQRDSKTFRITIRYLKTQKLEKQLHKNLDGKTKKLRLIGYFHPQLNVRLKITLNQNRETKRMYL